MTMKISVCHVLKRFNVFCLILVIHKEHPESDDWSQILDSALKQSEEMVQPSDIFKVHNFSFPVFLCCYPHYNDSNFILTTVLPLFEGTYQVRSL